MGRPCPGLFLLFGALACSHRVELRGDSPLIEGLPSTEIWVDAFATEGGDGSRAHPFKSLGRALELAAGPTSVHLSAGLYQGPFRPRANVRLIGSPSVVVFADGTETVIAAQGALSLEEIAVQGGRVGIRSSSDLSLKRVHFSGQRETAMEISGGSLTAEKSLFKASVSETKAVAVNGNASATFASCVFEGPFRRAVEMRSSGVVELRTSRFEGAVTGLHQIGGKVAISGSSFSGGAGAAIFSAQGQLALSSVVVRGHEYGLQSGEGARIQATDFYSVRSDRAAIAIVKSHAELDGVIVVDSGPFGALQLVAAEVSIRRFWLYRSTEYAVTARNSRIELKNGLISEVRNRDRSAGSGIESRQSEGTVESVVIRSPSGAGVLAAEGSRLAIRDLTIEGSKWVGLIAETLSVVAGSSWVIRSSSSTAIAVPDQSKLSVDTLLVEGNREGVVWAECQGGAQVTLSHVLSDAEVESSECIRQVNSPRTTPPSSARPPER